MSKNLRELQARKATHVAAMRAISDKAKADGNRDLTAEEETAFAAEMAASDKVSAAIKREEALIEAERAVGATTADNVRVEGGTDRAAADRSNGFQSFGEFAQIVRGAGQRNGVIDQRLAPSAGAPSTYGNEASGVDGGFLIPPAFSSDIFQLSLLDDALLPLTDNTEVSGNSMVFPKDETTPWGTDGVRAYWQAEASAATATKPKFGTNMMRLHKLMGLVPVTDELLSDSSALGSYLPALIARSIRWKTNEAILLGTGAGQPEGAFVGAAAIVQAKESGQATLTVATNNLFKMVARLPPGSFAKAIWLITPDALPAIFGLTLGGYPIYIPSSAGMQGNPYGTLLGRPIVVSQHVAAFTSQGDISLVDLSYYRTITKAGGIQTDTSMHLYFDADATAYRAIFRVDGQPKIAAAIAQAKGSNTLSPFIQLQAR